MAQKPSAKYKKLAAKEERGERRIVKFSLSAGRDWQAHKVTLRFEQGQLHPVALVAFRAPAGAGKIVRMNARLNLERSKFIDTIPSAEEQAALVLKVRTALISRGY